MEIEEIIRVEKKGTERYRLYFNSGRTIDVYEDIVIKHQLFKGTQMTENFIQRVQLDNQKEFFFQKALYYTSTQLRTEKEVRQFLMQKEADEEQIQMVIERLYHLNLLNDGEYAKSYVRTQARVGDKGPSVIVQKLQQKGVDKALVEEALSEYSDASQIDNVIRQAEKLQKRYTNKMPKEAIVKIKQGLIAKGFSFEQAQIAVESLVFEEDEDKERILLWKQADKYWKKYAKYDGYTRKQKLKQMLFSKGFSFDMIQDYIDEKELECD